MHFFSSRKILVTLAMTSLMFGCAFSPCSSQTSMSKKAETSSKADTRTFSFPAKSIGSLLIVSKNRGLETGRQVGGAQGKVHITVPAGSYVMLEINQHAFLHPELLDTVSVEGLDVLKSTFLSMSEGEEILCDKALAHLNRFTHINGIIFNYSDTSDIGIERMPLYMPNLNFLIAEATPVKGSFLIKQRFPQLNKIDLSACHLKPEALDALAKYKNLTSIRLSRTGLDLAAVKKLAACKQLTELDIGDNEKINDECMAALAPLTKLNTLFINGTHVTAKGLALLQQKQLKRIVMSAGRFSPETFTYLKAHFPVTGMEYLDNRRKKRNDDLHMILAPTEHLRKQSQAQDPAARH